MDVLKHKLYHLKNNNKLTWNIMQNNSNFKQTLGQELRSLLVPFTDSSSVTVDLEQQIIVWNSYDRMNEILNGI